MIKTVPTAPRQFPIVIPAVWTAIATLISEGKPHQYHEPYSEF